MYLSRGAQLMMRPQLRIYVLVPLLINLVLFILITGFLMTQFAGVMEWMTVLLPNPDGWLSFLGWIINVVAWFLWASFALILLLVYGYSFSILTNIIAAPFYGLLAEKTEALATGQAPSSEPLSNMIPRTIGRELVKIWYFVSRGLALTLGLLALSFIPILNIIGPIIAFAWGAWSMAIQYVDYAADNHQTPFKTLRSKLAIPRYSSLGFGGSVALGSMVPLVNIFIFPVAVIGGTLFWVEHWRTPNGSL